LTHQTGEKIHTRYFLLEAQKESTIAVVWMSTYINVCGERSFNVSKELVFGRKQRLLVFMEWNGNGCDALHVQDRRYATVVPDPKSVLSSHVTQSSKKECKTATNCHLICSFCPKRSGVNARGIGSAVHRTKRRANVLEAWHLYIFTSCALTQWLSACPRRKM
jgi:hypothetical protein